MPQVFIVCSTDSLTTFQLSSRRTSAAARVPTTPMPAASLTEAMPE